MPATATDRLAGLTTSVAIKPPCVAVATFPFALTGLFTLNGVALDQDDRVLVMGQTDPTDNGIYNASTSDWQRALDFDGARDVVSGTLVIVRNNFTEGAMYEVTTVGDIVIGDTAVNFRLLDDPTITYAQTQAEILAGVVPADHSFPVLHVNRYGINFIPGTTVMTTAFQAAINVAKKQGGVVTWGVGPYLIDAALDLTNPVGSQNCMFALIGQGRFKAPTANVGQNATPSILLKHSGHAFDTTGALGCHFENMSIASIDNTTYPQTCFLRARNSDGSSRTDRLINCYVIGKFHKTIDYNYGSENDVVDGCQFYNFATDANAAVSDITGFNLFRAIASTFTTIASGSQSCLDHKVDGGEFANFGGTATSDVFRWDGAHSVKVIGPWMDCATQNGSAAGRSLIYIDGTNGPTQLVTLIGIDGEAQTNSANYGIFVSAHTQTHGPWLISGNTLPNSISMLGGGGGLASISSLTWIQTANSSTGGGINFAGALLSPQIDGSAGTVVANSIDAFGGCWNVDQTIQKNGQARLNLRDFSQASGSQWYSVRAAGGSMVMSACDDAGAVTTNFLQFLHGGSTQMLGKLLPVKDDLNAQSTCGIYAGAGAPTNANGNNGDFYFRSDTPATANQRIYNRQAGAWVGIL